MNEDTPLLQQILPLILGIASALLLWYIFMGNEAAKPETPPKEEEEEEPKRGFTVEGLKIYDGIQNDRIFIALKGIVYDVTKGKDFYGPGSSYHVFAGRDASRGLGKMSLDIKDVDNADISDLSLSELDALQNWIDKFASKYRIAGHIVDEPEQRDYTIAELADYDGSTTKKPLLMVMRGSIYNVTNGWSFYGPQGGYSFLAGHDASRALAKMSLEKEMVLDPVNIDDLNETENQTLDDWIAKLSLKYPKVGNLKVDDGTCKKNDC